MASFLTNLLPSSGGAVDTTVNAAVDMAKASQRAFKRAADAKTGKQYAGRDEGPDGYKFGDLTKGIFQKTKKHIVTNVDERGAEKSTDRPIQLGAREVGNNLVEPLANSA